MEETARLIGAAGREIAEQMKTSVLIIEDEPIIALDIEAIVRDLGHDVIGIARTHKEAVALATDRAPGLVLADIQLADGSSGLEAVNSILQQSALPDHLHHRLSRAFAHRREAGAGVPDHQALPAGSGQGGDQSGVVLRPPGELDRRRERRRRLVASGASSRSVRAKVRLPAFAP